MVTYQEQIDRINATNEFIANTNDTSIENIQNYYYNLYLQCQSNAACNLETWVDENGFDPTTLTPELLRTPIEYTELREVLRQREILLDAGYKLNDFDATSFDPTKPIENYISLSGKEQPDIAALPVNYNGLTTTQSQKALDDAIKFFSLHTSDNNTSVYQNTTMQNTTVPQNRTESNNSSFLGINIDAIKENGAIIGVSIFAAAIAGYIFMRKK